jgi:hypothetical protein
LHRGESHGPQLDQKSFFHFLTSKLLQREIRPLAEQSEVIDHRDDDIARRVHRCATLNTESSGTRSNLDQRSSKQDNHRADRD